MNDGVAVLAYDCHSLRLLKGCHIDSTYGFMAFSKKEETIRFENADEVAANLPAFGIPLLQGLKGELKGDSTLDLAMVLIGKKRTTVREAGREKLLGGPACEGATHFARGAFVGAFAMGTGTKGGASLGTGLFSGRSSSSKLASYRDGDPGSCRQVTSGAASAPDACNALLRLELVALSSPAGQTAATGSDDQTREQTCAAGLVLTAGKCARFSQDRPHQCKPDDLADCAAQCASKDAGSCTNLGLMYSHGKGVDKDDVRAFALFQQACDGGDAHGCTDLGVEYMNGRGAEKDDVRAVGFFKLGCDGGHPTGCANLGVMYLSGRGVQKDDARGLALFQQAVTAAMRSAARTSASPTRTAGAPRRTRPRLLASTSEPATEATQSRARTSVACTRMPRASRETTSEQSPSTNRPAMAEARSAARGSASCTRMARGCRPTARQPSVCIARVAGPEPDDSTPSTTTPSAATSSSGWVRHLRNLFTSEADQRSCTEPSDEVLVRVAM